jgi:hypothetical protein
LEIAIPDLSGLKPNSLQLTLYQVTGRVPEDYKIYALVLNFVRVVDLALQDFENCRTSLFRYWNRKDNSTVPLGFLILGAGHFEACISNVKRAIELLKAIRGHSGLRPSTQALVRQGYKVLNNNVEKAVTNMRNAVQHLYGDIKKGAIVHGQAIYPSSTDNDGMKLGQHKILFSDLAAWVTELHTLSQNLILDWHNCYVQES